MKQFVLPCCFLIILLQIAFVVLDRGGIARVAFGFMLVSFLPGYTLLAILYDVSKFRFGPLEHTVLSLPISLALSALLGLALHSFGLGVSALTQVVCLGAFSMLTTLIAFWKETRYPHTRPLDTILYFAMMVVCAFGLGLTSLLKGS